MRVRSLLLALPLLVALLVGTSAVSAAKSPDGATQARAGLLRVAADYVGLAPRALKAELRSGKSLAQLATAQGKTVDGLKQALLAAVKARLDARVAAGRLSAERAQRVLARAPQRIERLVNRTRS